MLIILKDKHLQVFLDPDHTVDIFKS